MSSPTGSQSELVSGSDPEQFEEWPSEYSNPIISAIAFIQEKIKLVVPHIALTIVTIAYLFLGAAVFSSIEGPHEKLIKRQRVQEVRGVQQDVLEELWQLDTLYTNSSKELLWKSDARGKLNELIMRTVGVFEEGYVSNTEIARNKTTNVWTFTNSLFFATIVVTTIGYGNLVPRTFWGRAICTAYALFGIPLCLVTIADIGKFTGTFITMIYKKVMILFRLKRMALQRQSSFSQRKTSSWPQEMNDKRNGTKSTSNDSSSSGIAGLDYSIPHWFILGLLIGYTVLGAVVYHSIEGWSYSDCLYYCFVTMSTIGFGDLVPGSSRTYVLIFSIVFIVFGLVLTTMTIDLVGTHYIKKIHFMGRKIQDAKAALALLGGKAANMKDMFWQLKYMQTKYGLSDKEMQDIVMSSNKMLVSPRCQGMLLNWNTFSPSDLDALSWVDRTDTGSAQASVHRRICSPEKSDITE